MAVISAYIGMIFIWTTTPLAIKWSAEMGHFLVGATGRMAIGAILCLIIIVLFRAKLRWDKQACYAYAVANISIYGALSMTYYASQFVSSGLISVFFGFTPILASLLSVFWVKSEKINVIQWLGMILGVIGLSIIFHIEIANSPQTIYGLAALMIAISLHSGSSVWLKSIPHNLSPLALTTGSLLITLPLFLLTGWIIDVPPPTDISFKALSAMIYLGIFGSVVGFIMYFYVLNHVGATKTALIALITPVLALCLGVLLNNESLELHIWVGTFIIVSGLILYQWGNIFSITWEKVHVLFSFK